LDHALIRPGRIDIIANFKKCVNKTLIEMIEFFYDLSLNENDKKRILALKEYIVSPAEMGKIMFENFDDFRNTIDMLDKMYQDNGVEESSSLFYSKHGRMPVHDDGFYVYGSDEDRKHTMTVEAMHPPINQSELSGKLEKQEVEYVENKTNEEKNRLNNTNKLLEVIDYKNIETQQQHMSRYSITSTNKAYGDSLEMFDHTNVFSSGVSVF
jgi:hypothetical protein